MLLHEQSRAISQPDTAAGRLLADIADLAPSIVARADEMEAAGRIPPDLVATLKKIGLYRLFAPRRHGGFEADLPTGLEVLRALARVEGSVGWCGMIANGGHLFAPALPPATYEQLYANGADLIVAGSIAPTGRAESVTGGWRVSGRWPFASGCQDADWMLAVCTIAREGAAVVAGDGTPVMRLVMMPASAWRIEDTWHVAGLKGTGSHHIALEDAFVPDSNLVDFPPRPSQRLGPLYRPVLPTVPLLHAAFSVGLAEGAVDAVIALASTGRQQARMVAPMRESETFQGELGRVAADLKAARALLAAQAERHWGLALAGVDADETLRLDNTQAAIWVASTCVRIADACFSLGGGAALYDASPLQRRLRDMHAAAQHQIAATRHYPAIGKLLLDAAS
jgi:alkylation response protein AidB-like acyl-CoA dehydrogenase